MRAGSLSDGRWLSVLLWVCGYSLHQLGAGAPLLYNSAFGGKQTWIQTQNLRSTNRVPLDKLFNFSPLVCEMEQEICCEIPNEQCSCLVKFRTMFKVILAAPGPATT